MSFQDWLSKGWVSVHRTSREEIGELLALVERDLEDSLTPGLSPDWRLNIAYNAALQAATAALAASGYRATREAHHVRVIQSLALTIGFDRELILELDGFRKKRNISDYERAGFVSDQEADEMRDLAVRLNDAVLLWLHGSHPELLPEKP